MSNLEDFKRIPDHMIWKNSALNQIKEFEFLSKRLNTFIWTIGSHISKSIRLPVVKILLGGSSFIIRDNFYNTNIYVRLFKPTRLSLVEMFDGIIDSHDWEWYLKEISRAREYSWHEWTDEQMDDPDLLQLEPDVLSYMIKSKEEKERWIVRMENPEWWSKDWSSGQITWEGKFDPGAKLFVQAYPYAEGISEFITGRVSNVYIPDCMNS